MNVTGFAVLSSDSAAERNIAEAVMTGRGSFRVPMSESLINPSEFIMTEVLGLDLEYTVETVDGFRSLYTLRDKEFVHKGWVSCMNLLYGVGVNFVGLNCFFGASSVWFDVQGEVGNKGWLSQLDSSVSVDKIWNVLSEDDVLLLGLRGFRKPVVEANKFVR